MSEPKTDPAVEPGLRTPTTADAMRALLERAKAGDESTLPAIRAILEAGDEHAIRLLRGDLAETLERRLTLSFAGKDLAVREAATRKLERMREAIAGSTPSVLERLLAERIALCWFQLHQAELTVAAKSSDISMAAAAFHQRRVDRLHRQYLAAIKTLATVRRLAVPAIQLNVGARQVNVTGRP